MICSGRQTVILTPLDSKDRQTVNAIAEALRSQQPSQINITSTGLTFKPNNDDEADVRFEKRSDTDFTYTEKLGHTHRLYIIGGGHCALALSELMSRLDFHITIFDDRRDLSTIEKNHFADDVRIIDGYEKIGDHIASDPDVFVVVMTLGYAFDEIVIRRLIDREFRYFGVLGSKAKMKVLLKALENKGVPLDKLSGIRTPIGLPINSHTPEEIAVSIAAEIIQVKNS